MIVLGIVPSYLGFFGIGSSDLGEILGAIALIIGVVLLFKRSRSRRTAIIRVTSTGRVAHQSTRHVARGCPPAGVPPG